MSDTVSRTNYATTASASIPSNTITATSGTYTINIPSTTSSIYTYRYPNLDKYLLQINDNKKIEYIDISDVLEEEVDRLIDRQKEIDAEKPKPRPKDPIKQVYINPKKGTTTILWEDGTKTMVTCIEETFDLEKGIAMCFMKKMYDNRGCFNEFLKKWLEDAVDQSVKREKVKEAPKKTPPQKTKKPRFRKKTSRK